MVINGLLVSKIDLKMAQDQWVDRSTKGIFQAIFTCENIRNSNT